MRSTPDPNIGYLYCVVSVCGGMSTLTAWPANASRAEVELEPSDYLDFDLMIEPADGGYAARVVQSPAGEARGGFTRPFTDLELENFVLNVGQTRRGVRRVGSPQWDAALRFGAKLYDTVFADDVGTAFQMSLNEAQHAGKGLRVRLRLSAVPELASVPWEYLYSDSLGSFLSLLTDTPLVRFIDLPHPIETLAVTSPLTVLVVVSNPTDIAELDVAQEQERLRQALSKPVGEGRIRLRFLDDARLTSLRDALSDNDVHVLHFIGHGGFDGKEGVVAFENEAGTSRMVTAATLAMLLQNFNALRLVVLNACEGARNSAQDPFAGVAQALVRGRIPAVIAMQFEITDGAAIAFCHEFYRAVAQGQPIDAACSRARLALLGEGNDVEWGTPVLYLRAPNGRVFDVAAGAVSEIPHEAVPTTEHAAQPGQDVQLEENRAASDTESALEMAPPVATDETPSEEASPQTAAAAESVAIEETPPPTTDEKVERQPPVESDEDEEQPAPPWKVARLLAMAKAALDSGKKEEAHAAVAQVLQIEPDNKEARRIERRLQRRWPLLAGGAAAALLVLVGFFALRPDPAPPTDSTFAIDTTVPTSVAPTSGIVLATAPLTIDGDDTDWASMPGSVIEADAFHCGTELWTGPDDYAADWRLAFDEENLYLQATVTDDVEVRNPVSTGEIRRGDTVTVSLGTGSGDRDQPLVPDEFATCPERRASRLNPGSGQPGVPLESDFHLAFIPSGSGVAAWFTQGNGQGEFSDDDSLDSSVIPAAATELEGGSFFLEAAVPWTSIGLDGAPTQLGVRLEGRDEDLEITGDRDTYISNAPGSVTNNTLTWVTMQLDD